MSNGLAVQMGAGGTAIGSGACCITVDFNQGGSNSVSFSDILKAITSGIERSAGVLNSGLTVDAEGKTAIIDELIQDLLAGSDDAQEGEVALMSAIQQMLFQMQASETAVPVKAGEAQNIIHMAQNNNAENPQQTAGMFLMPFAQEQNGAAPKAGRQEKVNINSFLQNMIIEKSGDSEQGDITAAIKTFKVAGGASADNAAAASRNVLIPPDNGKDAGHSALALAKEGVKDAGKGNAGYIKITTDNVRAAFHDSVHKSNAVLIKMDAVPENSGEAQTLKIKAAINMEDIKSVQIVRVTGNEAESGDKPLPEKPADVQASTVQLQHAAYRKEMHSVKETVHVSRLNELSEPIMKTLGAGDRHMIIKLEPPELGSIQIKLRMDNGVLRVDFRVDSPAVKDLFSMAMPNIKASIEESGVKAGELFVDLKDDYHSDSREQHENSRKQNKQNEESNASFFDYFA